jgi:hypothetical protein
MQFEKRHFLAWEREIERRTIREGERDRKMNNQRGRERERRKRGAER